MEIAVQDDLDLGKIAESGQCFRVREMEDGNYRFITGSHVLYIRFLADGIYDISCGRREWEEIWHPYFDLDTDYAAIRKREGQKHSYVRRAMDYGRGLRVLRQDPWEMLVTFIISQRKNIPAISNAVELLAKRYGKPVRTEREEVFTFPDASELRNVTEEELRGCSLGYRAPYVLDAVQKVGKHQVKLDELDALEDEALFRELQEIHGVGKKVANCICLFGYGRKSRVPVDVWIARAMEKEFRGEELADLFGENAGVVQQYVFFYIRNRRQD